jgi:dynein heavy chain 2
VLDKFDKQLNDQLEYYNLGLNKLKSAETKVNTMSENAEKQRAELKIKQEECSRVMKQISEACERAADRKQNATRMEGELNIKQVEMTKKKSMIENELSEVKPMIDAAKQKVGNIKYQDMNEIKN